MTSYLLTERLRLRRLRPTDVENVQGNEYGDVDYRIARDAWRATHLPVGH